MVGNAAANQRLRDFIGVLQTLKSNKGKSLGDLRQLMRVEEATEAARARLMGKKGKGLVSEGDGEIETGEDIVLNPPVAFRGRYRRSNIRNRKRLQPGEDKHKGHDQGAKGGKQGQRQGARGGKSGAVGGGSRRAVGGGSLKRAATTGISPQKQDSRYGSGLGGGNRGLGLSQPNWSPRPHPMPDHFMPVPMPPTMAAVPMPAMPVHMPPMPATMRSLHPLAPTYVPGVMYSKRGRGVGGEESCSQGSWGDENWGAGGGYGAYGHSQDSVGYSQDSMYYSQGTVYDSAGYGGGIGSVDTSTAADTTRPVMAPESWHPV